MEPLEIIKAATFEEFQVLAKNVGFNPDAVITGVKLDEWIYKDEPETQKQLLDSFKNKKSKVLYEKFITCGKSSTQIFQEKNYRDVLRDIEKQIKLKHIMSTDPSKTLQEVEENINNALLQKALSKINKMSVEEQEKLNKGIKKFIQKNNQDIGKLEPIQILKQGGGVAAGAILGTYVTSGIILSSLGFSNAILLAVGLYSVPTIAIGSAFLAPLAAGVIAYNMGKHNFKKTIPFVVMLTAIRNRLIDQNTNTVEPTEA